jgi:hypothetical protein
VNGDPDGDALTNQIEYGMVVGASGDRAAYVLAALTPNEPEGEGEVITVHNADQNANNVIELTELLRVIQFFNIRGYSCITPPAVSEDGYLAGAGLNHSCAPHTSDYLPQDWQINLTELLRLIQFFNIKAYHACEGSEDGFCPGPPV